MRVAILTDIHGNLHALQAVLDDAWAERADRMLCAGDLVGYGPFPNEVIALLREHDVKCAIGDHDDAAAFGRPAPPTPWLPPAVSDLTFMWTRAHLSPVSRTWLRRLLPQVRLEIGPCRLMIVHGSPRDLQEGLGIQTPEDIMREITYQTKANLVISGHTHVPCYRVVNAVTFVNAGSVGQPRDGDPRAAYALLDIDPVTGKTQALIKRVAYDIEAVTRALAQRGLPPELAQALRQGLQEPEEWEQS
ncbi:MAG: metallophosphatase family protein [Chloroflexi bacterium]|nr:metallophosphatase family protein [Chloroflexota bacterium]MBU1749088.1 metallophosphatase family protein [Chloroflexota bacterium]